MIAMILWLLRNTDDSPNKSLSVAGPTPENHRCYPLQIPRYGGK